MALIPIGLITEMAINNRSTSSNIILCAIERSIISISNTLSFLNSNSTIYIEDIMDIVRKNDLEHTITILKALVDQERKKKHNPVVMKALGGVSEILKKIDNDLLSLEKAIKYHTKKYFSRWRAFYWDGDAENLITNSNILYRRYTLLFELIKIMSFVNKP